MTPDDLAHELWAMAQGRGPVEEVTALMADRLRSYGGSGMTEQMRLARVGDVMVVSVRLPYPQTHRLILETPAAVRYANELLADPKSGWVLESVTKDRECEGTGSKTPAAGGA